MALPYIEAVPVSALSVPALSARFLFVADPFPKHLFERLLPSTHFMPGLPSSVGRADGP